MLRTRFQPTVSAVIPVYNGARFLVEAIESVYSQTIPLHQVIVIDDGSTDGTEAILERLEGRLPATFSWISKENGGEGSARNAGLEVANGDLVAFLDHDDVWHPTKLAKQLAHFEAEPRLSVTFTGLRRIDRAGASVVQHEAWSSEPDVVLEKLMRSSIVGPPSTVLIRRAALDQVPRFDEGLALGCDWLMWLSIAAAGMRIGYLADALVDYRWHGGNMSRSERLYFESACEVFDRFFARGNLPEALQQRSSAWRARWHMLAGIRASQAREKRCARDHILRAARIHPLSVRPGWIRMIGVGFPPPGRP